MEAVMIAGHRFPLYTAKPGHAEVPVGMLDGQAMCQAAANNVLWLVDPLTVLPGWRKVGARPRWTLLGPEATASWHANQVSMQRRGEHRWLGKRHHIRIWHGRDHFLGQAHLEDWVGFVPRRHRVLSLSAGRDAVVQAAAIAGCSVTFVDVGSTGPDWDGRVAVIRAPARPESIGLDAIGIQD